MNFVECQRDFAGAGWQCEQEEKQAWNTTVDFVPVQLFNALPRLERKLLNCRT